jgi:hypothetical protein
MVEVGNHTFVEKASVFEHQVDRRVPIYRQPIYFQLESDNIPMEESGHRFDSILDQLVYEVVILGTMRDGINQTTVALTKFTPS